MYRMHGVVRNSIRFFVTVSSGPNAGMKVTQSVNNTNPRNLEMLNIARRDTGWECVIHFRYIIGELSSYDYL